MAPRPPKRTRAVRLVLLAVVLLSGLLLAGCRNQTQNRIRRSIQEFTAQRMYITVYSYDGKTVFNGVVDGKVTRSGRLGEGDGKEAAGEYVFWYDERGRYHQTDLPYLVTTYDLGAAPRSP